MRPRVLLDSTTEGGGGTPKPTNQPAPPNAPGVVKKTAVKTPNEIALEKKLAVVEDKLSGLEGWKSEVDSLLEGLGAGAPSPAPVKVKSVNAPAPAPVDPPAPTPQTRKGFLETVESDIWGTRQG